MSGRKLIVGWLAVEAVTETDVRDIAKAGAAGIVQLNRAGHTTMPRQCDHVFRPQSCKLLPLEYYLMYLLRLLHPDTDTEIFFKFFAGP